MRVVPRKSRPCYGSEEFFYLLRKMLNENECDKLGEKVLKQLTAAQIRRLFIQFFEEKGHQVEPSASLVPKDDPSLLWINSGVATLKKYFDGTIIPDNPRIVNVQKSICTYDIENVGFTARHHTFFEMLGNF